MIQLKNWVKSMLNWIRFQQEIYRDGRRYLECVPGSRPNPTHSVAQLESHIIRRYHVVEKGLSMPDFKPRFGEDMVRQLATMIRQWECQTGLEADSNSQIASAVVVLRAYGERHRSLGIDVSDILDEATWNEPAGMTVTGGVKTYQTAQPEDREALNRMLHARCSVRHFNPNLVPERAAIERAVAAAIQSPSVCNRQTWRAHLFEGARAREVLALQEGNRGFGHTIPAVFIVSSDLRFFTSIHERYQAWTDGGMFAMSLLLGLQAEGLGAVPLNWCVMNERDEELRKVANIPAHERIIMFIGFGHPAADCTVPVSQRRPVADILREH